MCSEFYFLKDLYYLIRIIGNVFFYIIVNRLVFYGNISRVMWFILVIKWKKF